jgi:hypothetical protein
LGTVDEHTWPVEQRAEGVEKMPDSVRVRDRVSRVHHEIGVEGVERPDPRDEPATPRGQVGVGDMQHPDRPRTLRQHGNIVVAQPEHVALDDRHIAEAGQARGGAERERRR